MLSFFFGQARQLPEWFRAADLNDAIVLFVLGTLVYWLVKLRPRARRNRSFLSSKEGSAGRPAPKRAF